MTVLAPRWPIRTILLLLPLCCIYFISSTFILALPLWVGGLVRSGIADEVQAGWLATLELGSVAATMLLVARKHRRPSMITHLFFAALAIGAYAASAYVTSFWVMPILRICAGIGFGWLLSATLAAAAGRENPTLTFGVMEIALALYASIFYEVVGHAVQKADASGGFIAITAGLLIFSPAILALGKGARVSIQETVRAKLVPQDWLLALAHFLFFTGMFSFWTFLERKASVVGLQMAQLGSVLSVAFFAGLLGSALTLVLIPWLGRKIVIPTALFYLAILIVLLGQTGSAVVFMILVVLIKAGFLFYTVSMSGLFAQRDPSGRLNTTGLALAMIGTAAGPTIGGPLLKYLGFGTLAMVVALFWMTVFFLIQATFRKTSHPA